MEVPAAPGQGSSWGRWRWRWRGQLVLVCSQLHRPLGRTEESVALAQSAAPLFLSFPSADFKTLCLLPASSGRRVASTLVDKDSSARRETLITERERSCSVFESREVAGVGVLQSLTGELQRRINTNLSRSGSQSLWGRGAGVCRVMSERRAKQ